MDTIEILKDLDGNGDLVEQQQTLAVLRGMIASDVTTMLKGSLKVAGLSRKHRPRFISGELKGWLADHDMSHTARQALSYDDLRQHRALVS